MDTELLQLSLRVGAALSARGLHLATAESCTGGWIAEIVTAVSGSSGWFECGFVTYSNASKQKLLGVPEATLQTHGAVSTETVAAMVAGALARSGAELALAVSGVAGPTGGTPEKPVGTVCFGWGRQGEAAATEIRQFSGDREAIRRQAAVHALTGLLQRYC